MAEEKPEAAEIVVSDEMTWDEYKELINNSTQAPRRIELIEKYIQPSPELAAQGVTLGKLKMSKVLKAFRDMMQADGAAAN